MTAPGRVGVIADDTLQGHLLATAIKGQGYQVVVSTAPDSLEDRWLTADALDLWVVDLSREDCWQPFLDRLATTFLPNRILAVAVEGRDLDGQAAVVPLLSGKYAIEGRPTAYVCENRVCDLPTTDPEVFARQIQSRPPGTGG